MNIPAVVPALEGKKICEHFSGLAKFRYYSRAHYTAFKKFQKSKTLPNDRQGGQHCLLSDHWSEYRPMVCIRPPIQSFSIKKEDDCLSQESSRATMPQFALGPTLNQESFLLEIKVCSFFS